MKAGVCCVLYRQSECMSVPATSTWAPQPRALLTDLLACCDGLIWLERWTLAHGIVRIHTEEVRRSLPQSGDVDLGDRGRGLANLAPGLLVGLSLLNGVVSDGRAAVVIGFIPMQQQGRLSDITHIKWSDGWTGLVCRGGN